MLVKVRQDVPTSNIRSPKVLSKESVENYKANLNYTLYVSLRKILTSYVMMR